MQDRQHGSVANRVQELGDVPGSGQRASFRFSVAYYGGDDQLRIVKRCAAGVRKHVSQFASLMNRTRSFRRAVATDATRERKLFEELVQTYFIFAFFRINFGVRTLEIPWRQNTWRAMSGTRHEDHVEIEFPNEAIQMNVDES